MHYVTEDALCFRTWFSTRTRETKWEETLETNRWDEVFFCGFMSVLSLLLWFNMSVLSLLLWSNICLCPQSSSVVKDKRDGALEKIQELIHSSPSILDSKGQWPVIFSHVVRAHSRKSNNSWLMFVVTNMNQQRTLLNRNTSWQQQICGIKPQPDFNSSSFRDVC